jgi:hypothetical protein
MRNGNWIQKDVESEDRYILGKEGMGPQEKV